MFIKILPAQIPALWNNIKFASTKVDRIPENDVQRYLNNLLISLLSDKSQCFVRINEERELLALVVTSIINDEISGRKSLLIRCLYSFQGVQDEEWSGNMEIIKLFAKKAGCERVITYSNNQRVFELAQMLGFVERYRSFGLEV